ncbi:MAG: hypothetical protein BMS9Abin29_1393 [Gemmatimonadota bacterium]|nr:MAG: hypothetical protein BMS9Abin29_1393 [Gemmatimonadota bacterium]
MILPAIRATFRRSDALHLVELLGRHDPELRERAHARLMEHGIHSLLDDPRVLNALLNDPQVTAAPTLIFYVLVRQALLEGGIDEPEIADYVASMLVAFGGHRRAYRIGDGSGREFNYVVDLMAELESAGARERFLLRVHLGDYSLWMSGLFPHYVAARLRRRGAPPLSYYEGVGASGYSMAADSAEAERFGINRVLMAVARQFAGVRIALNRISDRYFWPGCGDPVERLLREVAGGAA